MGHDSGLAKGDSLIRQLHRWVASWLRRTPRRRSGGSKPPAPPQGGVIRPKLRSGLGSRRWKLDSRDGRAGQEEADGRVRVRLVRVDRSGRTEDDAIRVLESYRPRYAKVAALAGLSDVFGKAGELAVVERLDGIGMTDYYGVSGRAARPEQDQMTEPECERKLPCSGPRGRTSMRWLRAHRLGYGRVRRAGDAIETRSSAASTAPSSSRMRRRSACARRPTPGGTPRSCAPTATRCARRFARPAPEGRLRGRGGRSNS
jgi:hypothetical protein